MALLGDAPVVRAAEPPSAGKVVALSESEASTTDTRGAA
jgi:hypothetical protein